MFWLICGIAGALGFGLGYVWRNREISYLSGSSRFWLDKAAAFELKWHRDRDELALTQKQLRNAKADLGVAEKQLIALRRTTPGRDGTGRFVSRPKNSAVMGSE